MYVAFKRSASISAFVASMSLSFTAMVAVPRALHAGPSLTWAGVMNEAASDTPRIPRRLIAPGDAHHLYDSVIVKRDPPEPEPADAAKLDAAAEPETPNAVPYRGLRAADPMFKTWQRRANDRLRLESHAAVDDARAVTASNPDDFIVVCEAGCRPRSDAIVSRVSRATQKLAGVDGFQRTTDATPRAAAVPNRDLATAAPKTIECVAGCYAVTAQLHWIREGRARDGAKLAYRAPPARLALAAAKHGASDDADRRAYGGPHTRAARKAINRFSSPQMAYNGAIVGPMMRRRVSDLSGSVHKISSPQRSLARAAALMPRPALRFRRPQSRAPSRTAFSAVYATASIRPAPAF